MENEVLETMETENVETYDEDDIEVTYLPAKVEKSSNVGHYIVGAIIGGAITYGGTKLFGWGKEKLVAMKEKRAAKKALKAGEANEVIEEEFTDESE